MVSAQRQGGRFGRAASDLMCEAALQLDVFVCEILSEIANKLR
jgi:hypothetical protein